MATTITRSRQRLNGAHSDWTNDTLTRLRRLAKTHATLTTDELWAKTPTTEGLQPTAMAAVIREAERRGWIRKTSHVRPSSMPQCHRRPKRVWRSALYAG